VARPLIIPCYDEVCKNIFLTLIRTAGISRDSFFALLDNC